MDPWHIVELLVLGIVGLVSAVLRETVSDHGKRIGDLEATRYTRQDAAAGREELKHEIASLREQMDTQHSRIFDRLDMIVDRLPSKGKTA